LEALSTENADEVAKDTIRNRHKKTFSADGTCIRLSAFTRRIAFSIDSKKLKSVPAKVNLVTPAHAHAKVQFSWGAKKKIFFASSDGVLPSTSVRKLSAPVTNPSGVYTIAIAVTIRVYG
jgi:hypothetical protein